jgi:CRP-like cAMP-binding protein
MSTMINLFRHATDTESFAAGQQIFRTGDVGDLMYALVEGEVDIIVGDRVVETVVAGGILGEMALVDGSPRAADAVARTDSRCVPIDERRFTFLVQQTPLFAIQVMRILAERIRVTNELLRTSKSTPTTGKDPS